MGRFQVSHMMQGRRKEHHMGRPPYNQKSVVSEEKDRDIAIDAAA